MLYRILLSVLSVLLLIGPSEAQDVKTAEQLSKKSTKLYQKARQASKQGKTDEAIKLYKKLVDREPDLQEAYLSLGGLHYRLESYNEAIKYFEQALPMRDVVDPEIYYAMATAHMQVDQYSDAAEAFDHYLVSADSTAQKYSRAVMHAANMHFAAYATANPQPFDPIKVDGINSVYSEYMPVMRGDDEEMIFVRRTQNQEDLYSASRLDDTTFAQAVALDDLNTKGNEGIHTISADGRLIVFTACGRLDGYGQCDLYYSKRSEDGWTRPINMGKRVNSGSSDSGPSLTADGRGLYFISDRTGGVGGKDIYYTQLNAEGQWYRPVNLGEVINSTGHEESPFIHHDGTTLYFRSNARPGMGGFDIYYARWQKEIGWSEPENIGYPINTKGSEGSLTVSLDGVSAYYASDRDDLDETRRDLDIYKFTLPPVARPNSVTFVEGQVTDAITGAGLAATLELTNVTENKVRQVVTTDETGNYFVALPIGQSYAFTAEQEGYLFYSEHYELDNVTTAIDPMRLDIALEPIAQVDVDTAVVDRHVVLRNIFFESGSAALLPQSEQEVNRLIRLLNDYPDKVMTIVGHTDNVGQPSTNMKLSKQRAAAVKAAIIASGITPSRVEAIGKGETEPIADNDTEDGRQQNRRVTFTLTRQ